MENRKRYTTDLTPQQWAILEPVLTQALHACFPTRHGAHHDLPPWQVVYDHFRRWQRSGGLDTRGGYLSGARPSAGGLRRSEAFRD